MSAEPASTALASWRQRLRGVVLPAVSDATAWHALRDGLDDLDGTLERFALDLPLALSLLVDAARSPRIAANFSGLQHVLRMLGSDALRARMQAWSAGWIDPTEPAQRLALQALATSRLACCFHQRWMRHGRLVPDAEYRLWVTALLGVARWKLPLAAPDLALQIERRVSAGERRDRVERSVLGCSVDALCSAHLVDIGFADAAMLAGRVRLAPALLAAAAQRARADALPDPLPPTLARALREPLVSCGLAYALALETQASWHSSRCKRLVAAAATCFNRSANAVLDDLHRGALDASGEPLYTRGLLAPAARLIRIPPARLRPPPRPAGTPMPGPRAVPAAPAPPTTRVAVATEATATRPARPPVAADAGESTFLQRCREQAFASLRELVQSSVGVLTAAGLPRCALFLHMKQPERIAAYYTHGFTDAAAARQTSIPSVAGTLLERLLTDPRGAYLITPAQMASIRGKLPEALAAWPAAGGFVMATVQANERPLGFWWAATGDAGEPADARHFAALRHMAVGFGPEFARLIRAQRAAAPAGS